MTEYEGCDRCPYKPCGKVNDEREYCLARVLILESLAYEKERN